MMPGIWITLTLWSMKSLTPLSALTNNLRICTRSLVVPKWPHTTILTIIRLQNVLLYVFRRISPTIGCRVSRRVHYQCVGLTLFLELYFIDNSTNQFVPIYAKIRFYYFLARSSNAEPVISFPKGLRMIAGNPFNKAPTSVASFTCQINEGFTDSLEADNFNFNRDCPYGMKTELFFPPCWDGYNLYKADGSHMAYPSQNVRDGMCPWTHPIRLPAIQLEYTWRTSYYNPGTVLNGRLAWANGDTTGYGIHGDFVNGWDLSVLDAALKDPSCVGINMSM